MISLNRGRFCCVLIALLGSAFLAQAASDDECSIAKTNKTCTLIIDRQRSLALPTIQMYPGSQLKVTVRNPYYFERYFMDYSAGQLALAPDVASSIVTGLLPLMKNLSEFRLFVPGKVPAAVPEDACSVENVMHRIATAPGEITKYDPLYMGCLGDFAKRAGQIYRKLEPAIAPDSQPQGEKAELPTLGALNVISREIIELYQKEVQLSNTIGYAAKLDTIASPEGKPALNSTQANIVRTWVALSTQADAVAKDLIGYAARIDDLSKNQTVNREVELHPIEDPQVKPRNMTTRQVTYAINALNLLQNSQEAIPDSAKKKTIASITVLFGDSRWEVSAGTLFSTLADRSFSIEPLLENGDVASKQVAEKALHPTVVPFGAVNFRISHDLKAIPWRSAFYWTFGVGINPNTITSDFATGPSISWRSLMFSLLWHVGHDVRLTRGFYKNQSFGPDSSVSSATTENYWRFDRFAVGIAVRVPSLTGR